MNTIAKFLGSLVVATTVVGAAAAQTANDRVSANGDWSFYVSESPKECWSVSAPVETVNTKDGKPVSVRRGDILLFVTFRPGASAGEVSFSGGYPFAEDSSPTLEIDGKTFELFLNGAADPEVAWSPSADVDAQIVAAMKAGSRAVVKARSGRGTQTQDTFSLTGFTATADEASKRCAS
ncbi:invasion associated locus B family protein [Defluviimonas sp. WL0002]|uniref:Invasion associated locus B family protein n=1 Tax=Albidovulum marisflavi TaxID=2984159 RepID=A0ABT2Z9G0_9RHOB|nr:invasion associated locus B family protein [Defluviimonas sp. WL0002]MCV2867765.1 invasion associated locus B family protein [Defluviimonas sp. WL0002]